MKDLRFPIGEFEMPGSLSSAVRAEAITAIEAAPDELRAAVDGLSDAQLDTPYRPGGWTVCQVVHHLPDSHLNGYTRLKLALTEDVPLIRTYDEAAWALLPDAAGPVDTSLALLSHLHARWVYLWRRLSEVDWSRTLRHPDLGDDKDASNGDVPGRGAVAGTRGRDLRSRLYERDRLRRREGPPRYLHA